MPGTNGGKSNGTRAIALVGPAGAGKTSLAEALLFASGTTNRPAFFFRTEFFHAIFCAELTIKLGNRFRETKVIKQFNIGYSLKDERIIFPHYDWSETDKIVGIQGRITGIDDNVAKALGVPKYWNFINGYKKHLNLYGYAQNNPAV